MEYVSRAGQKLERALDTFRIEVEGFICADFGSNKGGFVDCLLQSGAAKVYAIDTGYGVLEWNLRKDERVITMERENAMHVELPEKVDLITIDTSWTKLAKVIPNALKYLKPSGHIVALVKPQYEAEPNMLRKGKLLDEFAPRVLENVERNVKESGINILQKTESPVVGDKGGNREFLLYLKRF